VAGSKKGKKISPIFARDSSTSRRKKRNDRKARTESTTKQRRKASGKKGKKGLLMCLEKKCDEKPQEGARTLEAISMEEAGGVLKKKKEELVTITLSSPIKKPNLTSAEWGGGTTGRFPNRGV